MHREIVVLGFICTMATSAVAEIPDSVSTLRPCIEQELTDFQRPSIKSVKIVDYMNFAGSTYYRFNAVGVDEYPWSFYVRAYGQKCFLEASGFVDPDLHDDGLPEGLREQWSRRNFERRIAEVGKEKVKADIKSYQGRLSQASLKAAKSLGLLD